jgi:hypothetical protein
MEAIVLVRVSRVGVSVSDKKNWLLTDQAAIQDGWRLDIARAVNWKRLLFTPDRRPSVYRCGSMVV